MLGPFRTKLDSEFKKKGRVRNPPYCFPIRVYPRYPRLKIRSLLIQIEVVVSPELFAFRLQHFHVNLADA